MRRPLPILALLAATACGPAADDVAPASEPPGETAVAPRLSPAELASRRGRARAPDAPLERIAFGSCNRQNRPQVIWEGLVAADPDVWVWLGDNVYGDTEDMEVLRAKYERVVAEPGYRALRERARVVGTWDDHDYGANNAGSEYPMRDRSQAELLDFLGEPADSPRRDRAGVYTSYTWGPPGREVKLILLDARYHRDDPDREGGDILGEAQWAWLEAELTGSDARLHLVADGIQFIPVDHRFEKWAEFPEARERLFRTLGRSGAPGIVLLSGDRHIAEIHRIEHPAVAYPLHEVTSSGMTHAWEGVGDEPNRYRVGELWADLNFGMVEVDWEAERVALQIRDVDGRVVRELDLALAALGAAVP